MARSWAQCTLSLTNLIISITSICIVRPETIVVDAMYWASLSRVQLNVIFSLDKMCRISIFRQYEPQHVSHDHRELGYSREIYLGRDKYTRAHRAETLSFLNYYRQPYCDLEYMFLSGGLSILRLILQQNVQNFQYAKHNIRQFVLKLSVCWWISQCVYWVPNMVASTGSYMYWDNATRPYQ